MAEILGAVSAATALAKQCGEAIKFACDVYSRYQNPEEVRKQLVQIQRVSLSLDILLASKTSIKWV